MDKYHQARPTRPFWAGLDPDKPEPLDKILAALHCYQVAAPSNHNSFYFEFTVDREDYHRLADGFPELQKLAALIYKDIPFVSVYLPPAPLIPIYLTSFPLGVRFVDRKARNHVRPGTVVCALLDRPLRYSQ